MTELKQLVAGLIRGERSFEEVSAALDRYVASNPDGATKAARLLQAAREAGLPHHVYAALSGQLGGGGADPDATVFAGDDASAEATVYAGPEGDATVYAGGDPDATVYAGPDGDATVFAGGDGGDATVFAGDGGESTQRTAPPSGAPARIDDDATRMDAAAGERTAVLGVPDAADDEGPASDLFDPLSGEITGGGGVSGDATVMDAMPDDDRTMMDDAGGDTTGADAHFDVFGDDGPGEVRDAAGAQTGASWPTAVPAGRAGPAGPVPGLDRDFQEGDLLRGRFELISKLGEGGMGAVWKGKDKLKEEARDRNPFVAIKMLQGDFKSHPEAFIALQRETAKQQRLAHPNIATVFDFDRDDANGTVFMTMEVLEGQPLDAFIRKLPADGLPEEEAMPLIEQLCLGLGYAHKAGLVHSDLKPGNAFLTKEGNIKLLDFGIARASKTKTDAEGETTLFDPGQLGALTPTYATIEMFEGEEPDQRDDIYALAIMAYQLLTGRHPYGKKSAPKAKELGLAPEPVHKLSKRQNRGLMRGLAFHRDERTGSVEEFLDSITRKKSRTGLWVAGTAAVLAMAIAGAWGPVNELVAEREREGVIAVLQQPGLQNLQHGLEQARALGDEQLELVLNDERTVATVAGYIASGGEQSVDRGLALVGGYPAEWQEKVKNEEAARQAIFTTYEQRINADFSPTDGRYAYPAARQDLDDLDRLYPDSAQVLRLRDTLEDVRNETLADLNTRFKDLLAAGALVPTEGQEDISDVLAVVRSIDPEHRLLTDSQLPFRFAEETERAINETRDYQRANALLVASTAYSPDDPKLKGLRYDLDKILTRIENEKRIAEIEATLTAAEPNLRSLADYQGVRDELVTLADLSAQSAVLERIQGRLKSAFNETFNRHVADGNWQQAEELLFSFARLLTITDLTRHRVALSRAEEQAGFRIDLAARQPQVAERVEAVRALLAEPTFTIDWETRLKVPYKELIALQPLGSPDLEQVRNDTARLLLGAAREARSQENFNQAREFVSKGLEFYPGLKNFSDEQESIASAEDTFRKKRAEEERLAKIESLKSEFSERAGANDVQAANRALDEMRTLGVEADDPFLAATAPAQLAQAYQRLATLAADSDDYLNAAELAREGVKLDPSLDALKTALAGYEVEIKKRERELRLGAMFNSIKPIDVGEVRKALDALKADFPERFDAITTRFANSRADQLRKYARSKDVNVAELAERAAEFERLFPQAGAALDNDLADLVEPRLRRFNVEDPRQLAALAGPLDGFRKLAPNRAGAVSRDLGARALSTVQSLERTDKAAAASVLAAAKRAFPGDSQLAALNIVVPMKEISTGLTQLQRGQLQAAAGSLAAAKQKNPSHPDLSPFESQLQTRRQQADQLYAQHTEKARDPMGYRVKDQIRDLYRQAAAICSDCGFRELQPQKPIAGLCHPGLAGFGADRRGQCWDTLGRDKGPMMVVVPPGGGTTNPFAIGKYEVSQRDFNVFCKNTNKCKVVLGSKSRLPATGVSVQLAEEYARWLSGEASKTLKQPVVYRLPTASEWEHAAKADGAQPEKAFNCRVMSGGNVIAGHDLVDARSGKENGWGLTNYVGNAKELVRNGSGFEARGGDFEVPLTRCDITISEPHNGGADATTGFRLVRELG